MRWAKNGFKDGEAEESIARRIKRAISQKDTVEIDEAIWPLLRAAVRKLRLQPKHVKDLFALANTVAKLGGSDTIEACHMAEAIQYRPPNWTKWR
jgi:predicted ATPase with chaperone activity